MSYAKQTIDQLPCNGKYFFSNPLKVTILANRWEWSCGPCSSTRQDPVTWNQGECIAQKMTEKVKTLKQEIEEGKCKRIKAEECSQHLSELQKQKDQEVERLTERLQQTEQAVKQSHHEREVERESFRLGIERLAQRKTEEVKTLTLALEEEKCKRIKAEERSQHLSELQKQKDQEVERLTEALRKLFESQNILQQRIKNLVEESQGTSEQMRQTFQEVKQTKLELKAEYESLRLEKERWSDERMTDVEKILGQKLDEQIRERTKAEEISRYLLEENCQLNARVKELMSRQAELAEVSCSTPSPDTVQENLVESNNDLTIGEANEESD